VLEEGDKRSPEEIQSEMKEEMQKPKPSIHVLKGQLTALRKKRQELARASTVGQHLLDFPALENSDLVSGHQISKSREFFVNLFQCIRKTYQSSF